MVNSPGFIFGGNTGTSYEQLQRRRAMVDQLRNQEGRPTTAAEGIGSAAQSIAGALMDKKLAPQEAAHSGRMDDVLASLMGGGQGAQFQPSPVTTPQVSTRTEADVIGDDAMAALGRGSADEGTRLMLARTLQAEAGNQGYQGMIDVGSVIANRTSAGNYGDGMQGVIQKPGQFSAWNGQTGYAGGEQGQNMNFQPSEDALKAADTILGGNYQDATSGATHYYNPSISQPAWGGDNFVRRGAHVFGNADAGAGGGQPQEQGGDQSDRMGQIMQLMQEGSPQQQAVAQALLGQMMQKPETMSPYQRESLDLRTRKLDAQLSGDLDSGVNLTVNNTPNAPQAAKPKTDSMRFEVKDADGNVTGFEERVIPGSATARQIESDSRIAIEKGAASLELLDSIINDPSLPGITGMLQGRLPPLSQAGTDLNEKLNQVKGKAFLEAFATLKGGGQITEIEGNKATAAIARLERVQSYEAYKTALEELKDVIKKGMNRARRNVIVDASGNETRIDGGGDSDEEYLKSLGLN